MKKQDHIVQKYSTKSSTRGQAHHLAMIILLLAFLIIILALTYKIGNYLDYNSWKSGCAASVRAHNTFKESDVVCPTQQLTIKASNADVAKKEIATAMVDCFEIFGEGKLNLFDYKEEKFCSVCTLFEVDKDVKGIIPYLFMHRVRRANSEPYYADYLIGAQAPMPQGVDDTLVAGKKYGIVFTYIKDPNKFRAMATRGGIGAGVGSSIGVGLLIFTPAGWVTALVVGGAGAVVTLIGIDEFKAIGNIIDNSAGVKSSAAIALISYDNQDALTSLGCTKIESLQIKT